MKHAFLKTLLFLLCISVCAGYCRAAVYSSHGGYIMNNNTGAYLPMTSHPITPSRNHRYYAPSANYLPNSSISNRAHNMTNSVTYTTVPTPGYGSNTIYYNNGISVRPYYNQGVVIRNQSVNPVVNYPVNNQYTMNNGYTYTSVTPLPTSSRTTTYTNGGNTYTYTEEYTPYIYNSGQVNGGRFLSW